MQKITENVYSIEGLRVGRVYVLRGTDGVTLVDASLPGAEKQIERDLHSAGIQMSEVKRILITHAHPDHIGSLADLQKITSSTCYVHPKDAPVVRGEQVALLPKPEDLGAINRFLRNNMPVSKMPAARVDREIGEGDVLDEVLSGLTVVGFPGHSFGQVGFWLPAQKLMICGDTLMHMPNGLWLPFALFTSDMAEAKRSIKKLATMDVEILCFGHGSPVTAHAASVVRAFAERI